MKSKLLNFLSEIAMVMIGVFLGMLVTDWNTQRNLRSDRREVVASIKRELMANKEQIVSLAEGRKKFLSAYDSLTKLQPIDVMNEKFYARPFAERLPKWRGIGTYNPDHAMFDAAKFSNVLIGMDISLLEKLSRIYNRQSALHALHNTFLHRFYEINSETTYGEVDRMVNQMRQELWGNQYLLTKEYDSVIEAIDRF